MSMILDALRKMEQERKTDTRGKLDLRPEVVSYSGRPRRVRDRRHLFAAGGVIMLLAGAGALLLLKNVSRTPEIDRAAVASPPLPEKSGTASLPAYPVQPITAPPTSGSSVSASTPPRPSVEPARPQSRTASISSADTRNLSISGIAWQEERKLRRAVVNGELVSEGSVIDGFRIVEIREDRIRFSRNARTFEVQYASAFSR